MVCLGVRRLPQSQPRLADSLAKSAKGEDAIRAADIPPIHPAFKLDRRRERLLASALSPYPPTSEGRFLATPYLTMVSRSIWRRKAA
jgi:hypothetical protein